MPMPSSKPQGRPLSSSVPPSPLLIDLNPKLRPENQSFFREPTIDDTKRPTTLFPSPTREHPEMQLGEKSWSREPEDSSRGKSHPGSLTVNSNQPTLSLTVATPLEPKPSRNISSGSTRDIHSDQVPFQVRTGDIPRKSSGITGLTESGARGLAMVRQRLSMDGMSASSREGSPVMGASSNENSDAEKSKKYRRQVEELKTMLTHLQANLDETLTKRDGADEELARSRTVCEELYRQNMELHAKLVNRERDYDIMSKNYLDHVRLIRATDDDHSTIIDRLSHLKSSIEQMIRKVQGSRSVNLHKEAAIDRFRRSGKLERFPIEESKLESYILNLFMESEVMSILVKRFFSRPLSCIFDFNEGFQDIYDWMYERNDKLAVRWRQQLCVMLTQDPAAKKRQDEEVAKATVVLTELISNVYGTNESSKIRELCNKAFDLSVAMTAQPSVISPVSTPLGQPFDEESMLSSIKSNVEGTVALVIFPAFKDSDYGFHVNPKVWCY